MGTRLQNVVAGLDLRKVEAQAAKRCVADPRAQAIAACIIGWATRVCGLELVQAMSIIHEAAEAVQYAANDIEWLEKNKTDKPPAWKRPDPQILVLLDGRYVCWGPHRFFDVEEDVVISEAPQPAWTAQINLTEFYNRVKDKTDEQRVNH